MESTRSSSRLLPLGVLGLTLALVHCGAGDHASPTAPGPAPAAPQAVAPTHSGRIAMPVGSSALKPEGFKASIHLDPKPDSEGIIHGSSPLLVHFDLCGSTPGVAGGELTYLYDFNFDDVADVIDHGSDCQREHKYNAAGGDGKAVEFRSNVCVVAGDPEGHGPDTYFSCRTIQAEVPVPTTTSAPVVLNPASGGCAHSPCQEGDPLDPTCNDCVAAICNEDSFCCAGVDEEDGTWDSICVDEVQSICHSNACGDSGPTLDLSAVPLTRRSVRRP